MKSIYLGVGYNPIAAVGLYGGDSRGPSTESKFHTQVAFLRKDIWLEDSRLWSLYLQVDYGKLEHESSYGSELFWTREAGGHVGVLFIQGFHLSYTYRRRDINENRILVEDYFIDREYHTYTAGISLYWNLKTFQLIFP